MNISNKTALGNWRFKISAFCIGGQFLAAISSAAISEAAYCGDPMALEQVYKHVIKAIRRPSELKLQFI